MRNLKSLTTAALVFASGLTGCYSSVRVVRAVPPQPPVIIPPTTQVVYTYPDVWVDDRPIFRPVRPRVVRRLPPPPRPLFHHKNPYFDRRLPGRVRHR